MKRADVLDVLAYLMVLGGALLALLTMEGCLASSYAVVQCVGPRPFVCDARCAVWCTSSDGDDGGVVVGSSCPAGVVPDCWDSTKFHTPTDAGAAP